MANKEDHDTDMTIEGLELELAKQMETRKKTLWRHDIPAGHSLEEALTTLTKGELDDIRYNLCVQGISQLKKQDMAKALVPAIVDFSHKWMVTVGIEQYNIMTHISRKNGVSTVLDMEDVRMDYMRSIGMIFSGKQEGKAAWYMPNEILNVYTSMDNEKFRKIVSFNDEIVHVVTGMLYYYGYMSYDKLHEFTNELLAEGELDFVDFMGILFNAGCWQGTIVNHETGMAYYSVLDIDNLVDEQVQKEEIAYRKFTYEELYQAGDAEYVDETDGYKALVGFLGKELKLDQKIALEIAGEVVIMVQNDEEISDILEYMQEQVTIPTKECAEILAKVLLMLNHTTRKWKLKGHSLSELHENLEGANQGYQVQRTKDNVVKFVPRSSTVGRNDPCPCGSGKKYKKCCLFKEV